MTHIRLCGCASLISTSISRLLDICAHVRRTASRSCGFLRACSRETNALRCRRDWRVTFSQQVLAYVQCVRVACGMNAKRTLCVLRLRRATVLHSVCMCTHKFVAADAVEKRVDMYLYLYNDISNCAWYSRLAHARHSTHALYSNKLVSLFVCVSACRSRARRAVHSVRRLQCDGALTRFY